jgi:hypothetical protein
MTENKNENFEKEEKKYEKEEKVRSTFCVRRAR